MLTSTDNGILGTASRSLPTEVVYRILTHFATQLRVARPGLQPKFQTKLLELRLVCKSWSAIIIPMALTSIRIKNAKQARTFLQHWKSIFSYLPESQPQSFPVRQLELHNLVDAIVLKTRDTTDSKNGGQDSAEKKVEDGTGEHIEDEAEEQVADATGERIEDEAEEHDEDATANHIDATGKPDVSSQESLNRSLKQLQAIRDLMQAGGGTTPTLLIF